MIPISTKTGRNPKKNEPLLAKTDASNVPQQEAEGNCRDDTG
jgi:hypothetical protein